MAARGYLSRRSKKANTSSYKSAVKAQRKKRLPPWDSTISNLLVHKPTKEELRRRHELHQPVQRCSESPTSGHLQPNNAAPGHELETFKTPENTRNVHHSVLEEILSTNEKMQKALTYSDKKISAVPDLFGDDPKKYRGFPNITCAPPHKGPSESESVRKVAFMKEPSLGASNLDILSDTVMDGTALNDISDLHQNTDENNNNDQTISTSYQPRDADNTSPSAQPSSSASSTNSTAVKATKPPSTTAPALKGLHDLREMVDSLEDEVRMFEEETGREPPVMPFVTRKEKESFGGFTVSILHAITKLVGYLRDCEKQRKTDATLKQDICVTLQQQQMLIDALTNEVICLQEENRKLREDWKRSKDTSDEQIAFIKRELYAVLKSREYETLSSDMDFLYDQNTQNSRSGKVASGRLEDVIRNHGLRDNFEYLSATTNDDFVERTEETCNKSEGHFLKFSDSKRIYEERTSKTFQQSKTTVSPATSVTSSTDPLPNNPDAGPLGLISNDQERIDTAENPSVNNLPFVSDRENEKPTHDLVDGPSHQVLHDQERTGFPENVRVNNQPFVSDQDTNKASQSQVAESPEQIPKQQRKTSRAESPHVNNQPFLSKRDHDTVGHNVDGSVSPETPLSTSGVFTYYNPALTDTKENDSPTSPTSCATDRHVRDDLQRACVFIGRNQQTSPHRRGKQGDRNHSLPQDDKSPTNDAVSTSQSKISPEVSPLLFERQLLHERPGQEKVVVRLPSMWQDSHTGMQRNTSTTNITKPVVKQKSDNGWFALSSHVDLR